MQTPSRWLGQDLPPQCTPRLRGGLRCDCPDIDLHRQEHSRADPYPAGDRSRSDDRPQGAGAGNRAMGKDYSRTGAFRQGAARLRSLGCFSCAPVLSTGTGCAIIQVDSCFIQTGRGSFLDEAHQPAAPQHGGQRSGSHQAATMKAVRCRLRPGGP